MKDFKYKTTFSSIIRTDNKAAKFISNASLEDLRKFIPKIEEKQKDILLPVSFDACVAGVLNKNDDGITIEKGIEIYKNFIGTYTNIEHNRQNVLGYICGSTLTEYGTDQELTPEEILEKKIPYNITLSAILWKIVNEEICQYIEDSNDPKSDKYLQISASWELGFDDFQIVAIKGNSKNIKNGEIISDPKEISKLEGKLRCYGGTGVTDNNIHLYRLVTGEVLPLGIGLTENPAGAVQGIATKPDKETIKSSNNANEISDKLKEMDNKIDTFSQDFIKSLENLIKKTPSLAKSISNLTNNISQSQENNVKIVDKIMKIKSLQDITDESIKETKASAIVAFVDEFVSEKLKEANDKFKAEQDAKSAAVKAAEDAKKSVDDLNKKIEDLTKNFNSVKAQADQLQKEKDDAEKLQKYNQRMTQIDETFELSKEQSEVIAKKIKEMTDEVYAEYQKELETLMAAAKKKKAVKDNDKDAKDMEEGAEPADDNDEEDIQEKKKSKKSKASVNDAEVVEEAIDNGEKDKTTIANAASGEETLKQRMAKYFAPDQFEIKINRK